MAAERRPRLGLLGGSFDPIHIGHVLMGRWARQALALDEVWFIPQAQSADGKRLSPVLPRWKALQRALRGEQGLKACDVDLRLGGVSRAIETLEQLRFELGPGPQFTWILGQDQAARLPTWQDAGDLPLFCDFFYFERPGSANVRKSIHKRFRCFSAPSPSIDVSSTWIRQQRQAGKTFDLATVS